MGLRNHRPAADALTEWYPESTAKQGSPGTRTAEQQVAAAMHRMNFTRDQLTTGPTIASGTFDSLVQSALHRSIILLVRYRTRVSIATWQGYTCLVELQYQEALLTEHHT